MGKVAAIVPLQLLGVAGGEAAVRGAPLMVVSNANAVIIFVLLPKILRKVRNRPVSKSKELEVQSCISL